ncbi:MAG TPA: hypothetical protein GX715_08440 [Armatimonadetes bacterium]|jgi:hypothetical protein|nr:hypothetical protein [Armatimonadota bacterium]HHX39978.1 hypothetical protein [Armatimonadota bacterium]
MSGVSLRALTLGLVAVVAVCCIVAYAELVTMYIQIGFLQLPPVVVALLFFLVVAARYGARIRERFRLSAQELMTIYSMMLVASMVTSRGLMEKLIALLVAPNYYANEGNRWQRIFYPYIKKWMVPWDPEGETQQWVSQRFYEGLRSGESIPWGAWVVPLAAWSILVIAVFFGFLCLAALLRRQWADHEKLTFPLAQLPLEMARGGDAFLRNPLTWIGFAIPAVIFTLNGIHQLFPTVPGVNLTMSLNRYFPNPPFSAIYPTPLYFSMAAIGFFYFLPTDLLFSLWFFFALTRAQDLVAAVFNAPIENMPLYPTRIYVGYQVLGAYVVLAGYLLYVARPHLRQVWEAVRGRGKVDDSQELIPYRVAFWGLTGSVLVSATWFMLAGLSWWVAALEILAYFFVIALVMARSVAECGMLMTETSFRPIDMHSLFAARHTLGGSNLTALGFLDAAFLRDQRGLILTGFLDGLRVADGVNIRRRAFLLVFGLAIGLAILVAGFLHLWFPYQKGGIQLYSYVYAGNPLLAFRNHAPAIENPVNFDWRAPTFAAIGMAVTLFLVMMRMTFYWWPLHPMAYALSASWSLIVFWFPCFVAWAIKSLVQRYGGMKYYLFFRPFFLGMILGEFSMAVVWTVLAAAFNVPAPSFPWP